MTATNSARRLPQPWPGVLVSLAAVGALVVVSGGIAVTLEPTNASALSSSEVGRHYATATPSPHVSQLTLAAGSLVGGEAQQISGRGLEMIDQITVGGVSITDFVATDRQISFSMPRSVRYTPGVVDVALSAAGSEVVGGDDLSYSYEVLTGVDRQLEYAFRHWQDYNLAEYGTFNPVGGDCANFVSQTLIARGWEMTGSWFNNGGSRTSSSWIYTPAFESWLLNNPQYGAVRLDLDQRDQVKVGDIVVFDWNDNNALDHIQIVSAIENVDGEIKIKMVGHNRDSDYRDLDETITIDHPNGFAYFYSLPAA